MGILMPWSAGSGGYLIIMPTRATTGCNHLRKQSPCHTEKPQPMQKGRKAPAEAPYGGVRGLSKTPHNSQRSISSARDMTTRAESSCEAS